MHGTLPIGIPQGAGCWATQLPTAGTGSSHEQNPDGSFRKVRKCNSPMFKNRNSDAATTCDSAAPEQVTKCEGSAAG
eukprot:16214518-Heterocapsa_arctica.AAC.1